MIFRTLLVTLVAVAPLVPACGGTTAGPADASTDAASDASSGGDGAPGQGSDAASPDADSETVACKALDSQYRALANVGRYTSCSVPADCTIVSSDICYETPTLSLNAFGVTAARVLKQQWHGFHDCGVNDCGSGGGATLTPGCLGGDCVALDADGGVVGP